MTRADRLRGGLLGLLVGDALGVPYEFHDPANLPPREELEFYPPLDFRRAHIGTPPGTWSDDGAQALCLLASLLERGHLDPDDLGQRFVRWYHQGYLAVDGRVFDIGIQTGEALRRMERGVPALEAGGADEQGNGNGSLMRVLPLALWHQGGDGALVEDAHRQSRVTHGHPRSQVCCALYGLWARCTLAEAADPWAEAVAVLREIYRELPQHAYELDARVLVDGRPMGSGYVVDCLRSARWAVGQGAYEQVVKAAISLGRDTDTTACVAGGLAGVRDGVAAIPERWRAALRGQELVQPLLEGLLARGDA